MLWIKRKSPPKRSSPQTSGRTKQVYSYYSTQPDKSRFNVKERAKNLSKKPKLNLHNLPSIILALVLVISLLYSLRLNSNPIVIQNSQDANLFLHTKNTYQDYAHKLFNSSVFNSNKITVDTGSITQKMKEQYPELNKVEITIPIFSHRPSVYIYPNTPTIKLISGNSLYIVDQNGKVISVNPLERYGNLPTVIDESNLEAEIGKNILPTEYIKFISEIVKQFNSKKLTIESIKLPAQVEEVDIKLNNTKYTIKFSLQGQARQQAGAYLSAREFMVKKNINPAQYVDVRVDERVYYK